MVAAALGWQSGLVPEPLIEVLGYASSSFLLDGALTALEIAALAMVGGIMLGLVLALMPPLHTAAVEWNGLALHLVHPRHSPHPATRLSIRRAAGCRDQAR
jgi:hypothetical protein